MFEQRWTLRRTAWSHNSLEMPNVYAFDSKALVTIHNIKIVLTCSDCKLNGD